MAEDKDFLVVDSTVGGAREKGFAMAFLLASLTVMGLLTSVVLPVWTHQARREKEAELIFRGEQYARAVILYQRQVAGGFPESIEELIEGRFLRKRYLDPMTKDGSFELVFQEERARLSGQIETTDEFSNRRESNNSTRTSGGRLGGMNEQIEDRRGGDLQGGIVGVVSKSKELAIGRYRGADRYSEWKFIALESSDFSGNSSD